VAVRQGLQAKSFDLAAAAYTDAVGGRMSADSLRRVVEGWGQAVEAKRVQEALQVFAQAGTQDAPPPPPIAVVAPISGQANLSTDGGMILLRHEGWKEVKLSVLSAVRRQPPDPASAAQPPEPQIKLHQHSYQAGLWEADEMGQHQYLESLRRQLAACSRLSSVNDGAPWIDRITATNYPQAVQIIDWGHADERLWKVAKAAFGEGTPPAQQWAETCLDHLWHGRVEDVVGALQALDWCQITCTDDVRQSPGYFVTRQSKMDYARFRAEGYPIGSGTAESGINTVVHHRLRRQGRGWKRNHAQAMLAALSELHSSRFEFTWAAILSPPK
jgi:hypothetical protein